MSATLVCTEARWRVVYRESHDGWRWVLWELDGEGQRWWPRGGVMGPLGTLGAARDAAQSALRLADGAAVDEVVVRLAKALARPVSVLTTRCLALAEHLARHGRRSLDSCAEALGCTPGTLGKSMEWRSSWFRRDHRQVELTPEGKAMLAVSRASS